MKRDEELGRMSMVAKAGSALWVAVAVVLLLLSALAPDTDGKLLAGIGFVIWTFPGNLLVTPVLVPLVVAISWLGGPLSRDGSAGAIAVPLFGIPIILVGWATWFLFLPRVVIPFLKELFTGRS